MAVKILTPALMPLRYAVFLIPLLRRRDRIGTRPAQTAAGLPRDLAGERDRQTVAPLVWLDARARVVDDENIVVLRALAPRRTR